MIITAKYSSQCKTCGNPIAVGESIEWEKGSPALHEACAPVEAAPPSPPLPLTGSEEDDIPF